MDDEVWINETTGQWRIFDHYKLAELGIPDGYRKATATERSLFKRIEALERSDVSSAVKAMLSLDDEQRLEALRHFCSSCGCLQQPEWPCQCWNDD